MKAFAFILAALLLPAGAALAQTVLPSGAVAPTGAGVTPATVPGSQPVMTPAMRNAGSPRGKARDEKAPGMSHHDEKQLRKMAKVKPSSE